jgi:uroporphyrinogen decarboxylase
MNNFVSNFESNSKKAGLQNDLFLKALRLEPVKVPPIWMMRQAGRYLPEYRELRSKATSFMDFCRSPELCAKVALQPIDRFGFDAAIVFSDILTIPDAMGCPVNFLQGEGPKFSQPIRDGQDLSRLKRTDPYKELNYVMEAVSQTKKALNNRVPLIGFAGSPWTIACYMIEGETSKTFEKPRAMMYQDPALLKKLLEVLTQNISDYLNAQVQMGADVIMIFDTWGGMLSKDMYQKFSLSYMQKIIEALPSHIPTILFTKGGGSWLELMVETGCSALGIDWQTDLSEAKRRVGHRVALQGNLDPAALHGDAETIQLAVNQVLSAYGSDPGLIFNLGHGITPEIKPEAVGYMIDAVRGH